LASSHGLPARSSPRIGASGCATGLVDSVAGGGTASGSVTGGRPCGAGERRNAAAQCRAPGLGLHPVPVIRGTISGTRALGCYCCRQPLPPIPQLAAALWLGLPVSPRRPPFRLKNVFKRVGG
jgi:hypothetical protein